MRIVRFGSTKLVVRLRRAGTVCRWTTGQVLKLAATAVVAEENVQLPVWSKTKHIAIMIPVLKSEKVSNGK